MEQEYKYMVATRCFTFNHAPYIEDAMNGFTMQETTFPVITLIVDDASTDGEPEVIKQYLADHFHEPYRTEETVDYHLICAIHNTNPNCTFVVFLLKYNHYCIKKPKMPYQSEWRDNAKYIAICEGDDYWTEPKKLQKQVDFLESNPDYGLVHTKCKGFIEAKKEFEKTLRGKRVDNFETFIEGNTIVTATTLFSAKIDNAYLDDLPTQRTWPSIDLSRWLYFYLHSKVGFVDEITTVYRILDESASHSKEFVKMLLFYNTSADICRYYIEQSGLKNLWSKYNKKYLRLISRHYYENGKKVEWNAIARYFCFDLKSYTYIVASYILPKHGKKA